ncbi:cytochrome P450 [Hygrophoropsis aurantiaca]|uniref:Cytochrome P450 n=1 Tax=Hygrophoropsis aurantiaca TaxID=72124 RepID=A0ACB7ZWA1_9AGAM|nr:cytochrome P450 [Hygrophoropsis aurantiaca]
MTDNSQATGLFYETLTKPNLILVTLAATSVATLLYKGLVSSNKGAPLPPGPPPRRFWEKPLPTTNIARTLADLVTEYGPVVSIRQGSQVTVIIGRTQAAWEIMEKEGSALVDRPRSIAVGEILSRGMRILLERSGDRFRRLRRAVHASLQPKAADTYQPIQLENARDVILDILDDPKGHQDHARRYAASVILRVTYGKTTPTSVNDQEIRRIQKIGRHFQSAIRPGAYLVERFPLLRYVPGYTKELDYWHEEELKLFTEQVDRVKGEMAKNIAGPSFVKTLVENSDNHQLSDDEMAYLAGSLFGAGSDTTANVITTLIMVAACHPEAQARVQQEIDMVVGRDKLPSFDDQDSLPQLQAFVQEALRWRPITPIGFAHRATRDVIWNGMCIPEGASVIGCHWAITRDPELFPNPETFDPQRWLTKDGSFRSDIRTFTYGFGRRICPGQHVANRSIFINAALLLWSFRMAQNPAAPVNTMAFGDGIIAKALPFEVEFTPRTEEKVLRGMIRATAA